MVTPLIILVSLAILVADSHLRLALFAYVVFTAATLWLAFPHTATATALTLFFILALLKLVLGPLALVFMTRHHGIPENLSPSVNLAWRVALVTVALFASQGVDHMAAFNGVPLAGIVFYAVFSSVAVVVLHRNLLAHILGLLVLGSAITLAGAVFAPDLPGAIELADTFDAVFATLVGIGVARSIVAHDPNLDIRSLRELRG